MTFESNQNSNESLYNNAFYFLFSSNILEIKQILFF